MPEALQVDVTDSCIPAAIASDDVWAVGDNGGQGITMHWNGSTWGTITNPATG